MEEELSVIIHGGREYKLANKPHAPGRVTTIPKLSSAPGFRVWSKQEITDAIGKRERLGLRKRFAGKNWIMNQGQVGSCNPTATVGAFRRAMSFAGANDVPLLNAEYAYAGINGGRDQGSALVDANEFIREKGAPPMSAKHQFNRDIYSRYYGPEDDKEAANFKAEFTYEVETQEELATLLLSGQGAGVVAVDVTNSFMKLDRDGFPGASRGAGNHATGVQDALIVNGELAFDMFNSWDLDYGEDGYCLLSWSRHLARTIQYHKFFGILSVDVKLINDAGPVAVA